MKVLFYSLTQEETSYSKKKGWWTQWDSNPRPPACKAGILASEI